VATVHPVKQGKRGNRPQFSARARVARLRARLEAERDERIRNAIMAQLRAFERPPQGSFD